MSQLPESISPLLPVNPAPQPGPAAVHAPTLEVAFDPATQRISHWLDDPVSLLFLMMRVFIGPVLLLAPWSRALWDRNPLFVQFPTLSIYAANGAVRGIVSGLGLLNLWIAFLDATRRRDG
jgi:hypothetical protein